MESNTSQFNPHMSLIELEIFKKSVYGLFIAAVIVYVTIVSNSHLTFQFDFDGINRAVEIFKVPLSILALIIPLVALIASNHRSEQSREQMRLASSQNNFANHFKHLEEFEKYNTKYFLHLTERYSSKEDFTHIIPTHYRELYKAIYPNSAMGNLSVSTSFIGKFDHFIINALNSIDKIQTLNAVDKNDELNLFFGYINEFILNAYIFLSEDALNAHLLTFFEKDNKVEEFADIALNAIRAITLAVDQVLRFDLDYSNSELVFDILQMNTSRAARLDFNRRLGHNPISIRERIKNS